MKKVAFYTLGCKLNFSESSTLARQLGNKGFVQVPFESTPDVFVINTCSVTENADKKCRKVVRDAQKISPKAFIAIVGCYAQLKPTEISQIPGVDVVLGASEKFQLPDLLGSLNKNPLPKVMACEITEARRYHSAFSIADRTRSFLKVQDGCDYGCSFCTIPLARGKSRSDSVENIVKQARQIIAGGSKEIVLTGVNTGDFGINEGRRSNSFFDLLQALDEVTGIKRIRISSIEPNLLTRQIIELVGKSDKFMPHFHIPLQSGSDTILKKMRRRYLTDLYADRLQLIKSAIPDCCIGADVMVGFPGESEKLFLETYEFLKNQPLSYLHVFTYSERPNTLALDLPNPVPKYLRAQRSKMLRILSDKLQRTFNQKNLLKTRTVLFENDSENGQIHGYTDNYIRVGVPINPEFANELIEVKLTELDATGKMLGQTPELMSI